MQIGRLDIGLWKYTTPSWRTWFHLEYNKGLCGCRIWTIGLVAVTWLSDECLSAEAESKRGD